MLLLLLWVVGLPYSSIFWQFWLFFVFKFVVVLLFVVQGGTVCLPTPPSYYGMHNKISKGHFERCSGSLIQYVGFSVRLLALSVTSSGSIHAVASVGHIAFYRTERPPFIHVSLHRWTSGVFPPPGHWAHAAGATGERAPETCSQFLGVRAYPGAA